MKYLLNQAMWKLLEFSENIANGVLETKVSLRVNGIWSKYASNDLFDGYRGDDGDKKAFGKRSKFKWSEFVFKLNNK